jgi:hypothetical protein
MGLCLSGSVKAVESTQSWSTMAKSLCEEARSTFGRWRDQRSGGFLACDVGKGVAMMLLDLDERWILEQPF